jgi:hypothetical protein
MAQQKIALVVVLAVCALLCVAAVQAVIIARRTRESGRYGGDVAVQCRDGHVFTTDWIPGASFKAVRLGSVRFQYCPVGKHWAFVTQVGSPGR